MRTRIRLQTPQGRISSKILSPCVFRVDGEMAYVDAGQIIALHVQPESYGYLWVFRTLETHEEHAVLLPTVSRTVRLLITLPSTKRIGHVCSLFAHLAKTGRSPSELPDSFYVRVSVVVCGRIRSPRVLLSLLPRSHGE